MTAIKRLLLVTRHSLIEPLGMLHLLGCAKNCGCKAEAVLVKGDDFEELFEAIKQFRPDLIGFSVWTGHHLGAFAASDKVRQQGIKTVIGGPHATYFASECVRHADWVLRGESFGLFCRLLEGKLPQGIHLDSVRLAQGFPFPDRETLYQRHPELAGSEIKSIICSIGCPFCCSYCYAPLFNRMYGGFKPYIRPVDEIIAEAVEIRDHWPAKMIYFQDDIFGFQIQWLSEFAEKWRRKVGLPWHCQIRLELIQNEMGLRRLELFRQSGCTGITLAIESGNAFLREHVLSRHMNDDVIHGGFSNIRSVGGFSVRTEQILAVPFSDIDTDLATLKLNVRLRPEMAWTSILVPYGGTVMGNIAHNFRLYDGNNDDLKDSFFTRTILRHLADGRDRLESVLAELKISDQDSPLLHLKIGSEKDNSVPVTLRNDNKPLCWIRYNTDEENGRYAEQTKLLQCLFNWLALVPDGHELADSIVRAPSDLQTWDNIGKITREHLRTRGCESSQSAWTTRLAERMGYTSPGDLPQAIASNPAYFCFFPSGHQLARSFVERALFTSKRAEDSFDELGQLARHHLFRTSLYKLEKAEEPIAIM